MLLKLLTVSLLFFLIYSQSMTVGNTLINQNTNYNISIPATVINPGAYISLQLPSSLYPLSSLSGVTCVPACSGSGTLVMNFSTGLIITSGHIYLVIQNIVNPPSIQPQFFGYIFYNTAPSSLLGFTYAFQAGTLSNCLISFSPNTVSTNGVMTFSVTPSNKILSGGVVLVTFPSSWLYSAGTSNILNSSLPTCSAITNINSPTCTYSSYVLRVTSGFSSDNSNFFSFSVATILSIPVSYASTEITLQTQTSSNYTIDSGTCTISAPNPLTLTTNSSISPTVGVSFIFSVTATVTNKVSLNDILTITFPSTLSIISSSSITISINGAAINCGGVPYVYNTLALSLISSSGNSYVYNLTNSQFSNLYACSQISLTISGYNVSIPSTVARSTQITFSRTNNYYKYASEYYSVTANANTLNSATISLSSDVTTINFIVQFTLSFITKTILNSGSKVSISIPTGVVTQGAQACSNGYLNSVSFTASCTYSSNTLVLDGFGAASAGSNITFKFSGFRNPASTASVNFGITTLYSDTGIVDTITSVGYTATPDIITQYNVASTSYVNGELSNYTVTYLTKNIYPVNSTVIIGLPIGITFNSSTPLCSLSISNVVQNTFSCSKVTSAGSYYNDGISFSLNNSGTIPAASNISFTFGLINNPTTTQPSNPFAIYSSTPGGNLLELSQGNTSFRFTTTTPNAFNSISITPSSSINGATTEYLITLIPNTIQPSGSILSIVLPTNVTLLTTYTCYKGSTQLSCTNSSSTIAITLPAQLSIGTTYIYSIRNVVNPRTMTSTSTFDTYTNYNTYSVSRSSAPGITNTQSNNINTFSMSVANPSQSYMNSTQDIQFSITTTNLLTLTDYIVIVFPTRYKYLGTAGSTVSCSPYSCQPDASNISILKVTSTFNSIRTFSFTIGNYLSPNSTTNQNFLVTTYQADNTEIDKINLSSSNALTTFTITCTLPCRTCSNFNLSQCVTCYSSSIYNYPYLYNQSCYVTCPNTTYTSGTDCIICVSPCKTCTTISLCTSCVSTHYLFPSNSSCLTECPATYFANITSSLCSSCSSPCYNCSGSATFCTSCQSVYLLQNNQCLLTCSNSYFNISGICYACDVSCARCTGSSTNCTACATGYSKSGTECVTSCPITQISVNGTCVSCSTLCYECYGTINNCTSCTDGKYLYNGACVTSCPNGTLLVNGVCEQNDTTKSLSDNKIIPFPYLISCAIICIICFLSKFSSALTSIPAMGVSLNSVIEILATVTLLILTAISSISSTTSLFSPITLKVIGAILILAGILFDIIFNISTIVYFCKKIEIDVGYMRWKKRPSNSIVSRLCIVMSGFYYKFIYFQFCKAFGSIHLHATLENPVRFYPITIMTLIGVFNSLFVITGSALIALDTTTTLLSALYIQAIDCLLVKIVGAVLALASLKKSDDFFEDHIKSGNLQDLNQDTLQGLNQNMNDSFILEHSVSYLGGKQYLEEDPIVKKSKLLNSKNNAIREQDEDDGADMNLNKKDTGIIDQDDYFKTNNDKNVSSSKKLNETGLKNGNSLRRNKKDKNLNKQAMFDENGNIIEGNEQSDQLESQLYYLDDDQFENGQSSNKKLKKPNNRNQNVDGNSNDNQNISQDINQNQQQKALGGKSKNELNNNQNSKDNQNNLRNKSKENSPSKVGDSKSPGKDGQGKSKSPNKSQKGNLGESNKNKNKHQKLGEDSEQQINQQINERSNQFLSEEQDKGLGAQMKQQGNKPLSKEELKNQNQDENFEQNPSKTLGEEINLSSIQKKRSSRNKSKDINGKSPEGKHKQKSKQKLNSKQEQQRQKQRQREKEKQRQREKQNQLSQSKSKPNLDNQKSSDPNTPINQLKKSTQAGESPLHKSNKTPKSQKQKNALSSKSPKGQIQKLQQISSKQLDQNEDSLICFQKDSNQRQQQPDSIQPIKKSHNNNNNDSESNKKEQRNSLDNVMIADELNNNSGLIDSSAYGTEMIEGLVRGMSNPQNKNNDEFSELESAHEGDIQFPQVSPSQFNIQNQRYYDFNQTQHNHPHGQSNRQYNMESFRKNNTQHLFPNSHSQTSIVQTYGFYQNKTGNLLPEQKQREREKYGNIPYGISKAYQSFDQPLASIHEKGKSIRVSQSKFMNQSLSKNSRYQTVTPDDINKRHKLKSLQKIYLQPLDTKSTQPLHKRTPKYNI